MADELQEEPDENFDSWDLPVDWRLQKDAKKASNLGASMGIRFPLFRSLQKPSTTKRCLVYGGKKKRRGANQSVGPRSSRLRLQKITGLSQISSEKRRILH